MKLSIIIVNYNVRYFLEQALLSVRKALAPPAGGGGLSGGLVADVWVVDNNSVDDSVQMVQDKFPEVHLIANRDNVGFSTANNQAIRKSEGEYVLLLNPDTVVEEDTFEKCIAFMDAHPDAGALGVRMIDGSGKFLPESKRGFPSPWVAFCRTFGLSSFFPKSKLFNQYHLGYLNEHEIHPVDVLSGAFMLLRRSALDKAGLLDEAFFMYGEDIDLSYRIKLAGYENYYFPETTIIHYKGESTKKGSLNYVRAFYQAMIIFAQKHFTGRKARLFVAMLRVAIYLRALLADRPEHLIARQEHERIAADNPWGFKLDTPRHKYNRGELYNLGIARGTLNAEERYQINDHIVQSIMMLSQLPFPPHLRNVPELAGGHHEKMDGSGYPRHLKGDQIDPLARLVALVNYYDNLCNPGDLAKALTPHEALSMMFAQRRNKFDGQALQVMIRSLGVYPPGSVVRLSNDALALVSSVNPVKPLRPWVTVFDPSVPRDEAIMLDLEQEPDINIAKALRPIHLPPEVYEYLSPRKRVTYYFDSDSRQGRTP